MMGNSSCESRGYSKTLTLKEFMQCYIFSMGCTTVSERLEHKTYCMMYVRSLKTMEAPLTFLWSDLAFNTLLRSNRFSGGLSNS